MFFIFMMNSIFIALFNGLRNKFSGIPILELNKFNLQNFY